MESWWSDLPNFRINQPVAVKPLFSTFYLSLLKIFLETLHSSRPSLTLKPSLTLNFSENFLISVMKLSLEIAGSPEPVNFSLRFPIEVSKTFWPSEFTSLF